MKRSTRTAKQTKSLIRRYSRKWIPILGLQNWDIKALYMEAQTTSEHAGMEVIADTTAAWETLQATIMVYLPVAKALKRSELEISIVHELMHILLNEMREFEDLKHEERVCELLAKAFLKKRQ